MPKRHKLKPEEDEGGRPPDLTLASFLSFSLTSPSQDQKSCYEPQQDVNPKAKEEEKSEIQEITFPPFSIYKSKKGKLPITYESRSKGKKVTVVSNVYGQANLLLSELKKESGAGGVVRGNAIELQGNHQELLTKFLSHHPCVKPWQSTNFGPENG